MWADWLELVVGECSIVGAGCVVCGRGGIVKARVRKFVEVK